MKTQKTYFYAKVSLAIVFFMNVLLLTNTYALKPERQYVAKPDAVGIKYETYKIKVNDSVTLNSWVCLQSDLKRPFIVVSGSDAGNMANSLGQAKALFDEGYNVVLYDYRGFGESSDFKMNPNMVYYNEFSADLNKTIEFVNAKFRPKSIVLYGLSMGTIVSRMSVNSTGVIKGLILDSFVINPKLVVERVLASKKKDLLLPENASVYVQSNTIVVGKPILIFSGLNDPITKTDDYNEFLSKNPTSKMVTWDCNHLECFTSMGDDPNLYVVEVNKFVDGL
ncbi:alpha/beta fold hydrolase [Pedobacter foliorum]|uniref:alpha/beta fold hydrolase n=1 Tax=Pedobacter foliorum TaxID=2739058 RepID=UPI0015672B47|nr:alpha/beta fold hydrolase [Pedobacter foliorum]NRF38191.1 alpha/beta fold hydrolase [Pedobacter foliorum]